MSKVPVKHPEKYTQPYDWPVLPWSDWESTAITLQLWMQIIGKIKLALATRINHWWHISFYLTCRGLTTSPMPYGKHTVEIDFDFISHKLIIRTNEGRHKKLALESMSVADFYTQVMSSMDELSMPLKIWTRPVEIADPIPFELDHRHASYDAAYANTFWRIMLQSERIFTKFRSRFLGKASPLHFFWGSFDLALSRFSGRCAPIHHSVPNLADWVVQDAYSHEVSSCGFWPGGSILPEPVFYSYAYPAPPGFENAVVYPKEAYFHDALREFVLPYEAVRQTNDPEGTLLDFLQSTYDAAASLGHWDRNTLERRNNED